MIGISRAKYVKLPKFNIWDGPKSSIGMVYYFYLGMKELKLVHVTWISFSKDDLSEIILSYGLPNMLFNS